MVTAVRQQHVSRRRAKGSAVPVVNVTPYRVPRRHRGRRPFARTALRRAHGALATALLATARRADEATVAIRARRTVEGPFVAIPVTDLPVHLAAVGAGFAFAFALFLGTLDAPMLRSMDTMLGPPATAVSPLQRAREPARDTFSVIGEIAGVDPTQFARLEVTSYTLQPGDTISEIAAQHGLTMDTLISFNQVEDVRRIRAGETYQIPNRDGLLYSVRSGDSLASIAAANGTTINAILDANDLRSRVVQPGDVLFVPGARLNETERAIILGELFAWPVRARFTSGFGMRADPFTGLPRFHNGIDLASSVGTPIRAAASGRVVHIETQIGNYGRFVIIRHADGFQTLYAHLDSFDVRSGEYVSRGEIIGRMGNTGRSTGPHLHFSVIRNGVFIDPLRYLSR